MKRAKWISLAVVLAILLFVPSLSAFAGDTVKLKYGSTQGVKHTFSKADVAWIDYIQGASNNRIKITPYWGATLLSRRENTKELIQGVADLGYISPRTGYPLMLGSLGFPYGVGDWKIVERVFVDVRKQFPALDAEWSELKIMAYSVASNYQLISTKPVRSVADLKGMIVKATGVYVEVIKQLGGDGIFVPMGETYMALQKGTIDACLAPYSTVTAFKFNEVAKYITEMNLTSSVRPSRAMNLKSYNKLPKDLQALMDKSVQVWSDEDNQWRYKDDLAGIELAKSTGVEIITLPRAELDKVYAAAKKAMLKEAAKMDAKGLPGTELFNAVRAAVDKYGQ